MKYDNEIFNVAFILIDGFFKQYLESIDFTTTTYFIPLLSILYHYIYKYVHSFGRKKS